MAICICCSLKTRHFHENMIVDKVLLSSNQFVTSVHEYAMCRPGNNCFKWIFNGQGESVLNSCFYVSVCFITDKILYCLIIAH